jgi:hypothetical protein
MNQSSSKEDSMGEKVVPMIHVPNVRSTVDWYRDIGFTVLDTYSDEGDELSFGIISFGRSEVMFNQGGLASTRDRREVDLYVYSDHVDDLYERLKDRVEVVEGLHDTFYGMREFIIRDLNRFWITFGQPSDFQVLMTGVSEGDTDLVQTALQSGRLNPEMLTAAVALTKENDKTRRMLLEAGATPPVEISNELLQLYEGIYKNEKGLEVSITVTNGQLFATWFTHQQPVHLISVSNTTFKPIAFDGVTVTFELEGGKVKGFKLQQGREINRLKRVEDVQ